MQPCAGPAAGCHLISPRPPHPQVPGQWFLAQGQRGWGAGPAGSSTPRPLPGVFPDASPRPKQPNAPTGLVHLFPHRVRASVSQSPHNICGAQGDFPGARGGPFFFELVPGLPAAESEETGRGSPGAGDHLGTARKRSFGGTQHRMGWWVVCLSRLPGQSLRQCASTWKWGSLKLGATALRP